MITRRQALQVIANIQESNGYKESDGDLWLGPRLHDLRLFIDGLPLGACSTPEEETHTTEHTRGYLDGLTDERNVRTPEHSRSAYKFPHQGTDAEKEAYNAGYYEAKRVYREERQRLETEASDPYRDRFGGIRRA